MKEKGFAYNTINNHKRSLKAIFNTAIENDCLRKNPFDYKLDDVLENDTEPKEPLSPAQQAAFLSFTQRDKVYRKYDDEIITAWYRTSYFRVVRIDRCRYRFRKQNIDVNHQLLYCTGTGYYIDGPKTKSGFQRIKMTEEVYQAFRRIMDRRRFTKTVTIDGYSNFIFVTRNGNPKIV